MIYFDNAATTFPKPPQVVHGVRQAMQYFGANPGRSGHKLSLKAAEEIYNCRVKLAQLFGVNSEENIIFTSNCTHALNIVIQGFLKENDHVVISNLEHNSVVRPVYALKEKGITCTEATVFQNDTKKTLMSFKNAFNEHTKLVVCMHASNVFGIKLPVEQLASLCHERGIKLLVDGAQSAGVFPINLAQNNIDFFATAGHKGLYGPMGTGVLVINDGAIVESLSQGGTGSGSISFEQPSILPDKFESGTPNLPGIVGLSRGVDFLKKIKIENVANHEMKLIKLLYKRLISMENAVLYTQEPTLEHSAPVLSFNLKGLDSEYVAAQLNERFNVAVRAGLHCSPMAHKAMKTIDVGTVRVSPSYYNSLKEIDILTNALEKIK